MLKCNCVNASDQNVYKTNNIKNIICNPMVFFRTNAHFHDGQSNNFGQKNLDDRPCPYNIYLFKNKIKNLKLEFF